MEESTTPNTFFKVGTAVEFITSDENYKSLAKTYIYSVNEKNSSPYLIPHPQGLLIDETFKAELIKEGYDISKLKPEGKYLSVKASELKLIPVEAAPVEMITFTFPKEKWIGVVALMEGQADVFKNQKMLLMLQPGMTEEGYKEMQDIVEDFLKEAKKGM